MIKVLIADDEQRFRLYMQNVLEWEALGFTICGVAANGEQALEILENRKPDIALLDINMPKMDGIHLTEKLKEISPDTQVVFITGYSEFEYARKAVKLGVNEYILKPFSKEELLKVMLRLKEMIQKRKENKKEFQKQQKIIRDSILNKLVHLETEDTEDYREKLEQLGILFSSPFYVCSIIEIDKNKDIRKEDMDLWRFGIMNILLELNGQGEHIPLLFVNYEGNIVSILNCGPDYASEVVKMMEKLCEVTYRLLGVSTTIGVGSTARSLEELPESYRKAFISLQDKFVRGGRRVISYEEIASENRKADFYRMDLNEKLLIYLRKNDREKVTEFLYTAEQEMIEQRYSHDYMNAAVMGILSICLSYIVEMKGNISKVLGENFSPYHELQNMESITESFRWLTEIFQITVDYFSKPHSKRAEEIIREVEGYVQEHYSDFELTMEDIAEAVFLDISYVRKVFAKHRGYTVLEYITSIRMKAAREYLEQQSYSVSQISEMCGYMDAGYFSRCFKKHHHISPKQYVKQLQE